MTRVEYPPLKEGDELEHHISNFRKVPEVPGSSGLQDDRETGVEVGDTKTVWPEKQQEVFWL